MALQNNLRMVHPGEVLKEEFMEPMGISCAELAKLMDVTYPRVSEILLGRRGISVNSAIRLDKVFKTTAVFWCNLQIDYDLKKARLTFDSKKVKQARFFPGIR